MLLFSFFGVVELNCWLKLKSVLYGLVSTELCGWLCNNKVKYFENQNSVSDWNDFSEIRTILIRTPDPWHAKIREKLIRIHNVLR
jgi:hypothetical protein